MKSNKVFKSYCKRKLVNPKLSMQERANNYSALLKSSDATFEIAKIIARKNLEV